ncbi:hypothetical protein [Nocardioides ferulae]|uniref:hypothetical protein n=1 Tax=Nocardioides ferulae TaxID=2340821 RepID=UPI000EAC7D32|nr:hypothetical protein [Nocardioides ferulae]
MNDHDTLEQRLERTLATRADRLHDAPFGLAEVRGRAHTIRRRRRMTTAVVAAAAVAAIAVPVGLTAGGDASRTEPLPPAVPPAVGTVGLTIDVAAGEPPAAPYLRVDDEVLIDGDRELPLDTPFSQVVPWDDGYLALGPGEPLGDDWSVHAFRLDADFRIVDDLGPAGPVVVGSPDGSRVAWVELTEATIGREATVAVSTDGADPVRTPVGLAFSGIPAGMLPDAVVYEGDEGDGPRHRLVPFDGSDPVELPGLLKVWDASPASGLLAVQTDYLDLRSQQCSGVIEADAAEPLWSRCDLRLEDLSPDGSLVIGYAGDAVPTHDNLSILDARTGDPVVTFDGTRGGPVAQLVEAAWEDDDHVLAVVQEDTTQVILRLGVDGSAERVSPPDRVEGLETEFFLLHRPFE